MEKQRKNTRRNRGITLIALVITVIILLILAGISIAELTGNKLFENVKLAKEKSEQVQDKENITLDEYKNIINKYVDGTRDNKNYNYEDNEEVIVTNDTYNGKIIKKVCLTGTLSSGSKQFLDLSSYNIDKILDISGYAIVDKGVTIARVGCYYTSVAYIDFYYNINNKYLYSVIGTQYNGGIVHLIITFTDNQD